MKDAVQGWPLFGLLFTAAATGALLITLLPASPLLVALALLALAAAATWLLQIRPHPQIDTKAQASGQIADDMAAIATQVRLDNAKLAHEIGNVIAVISGYLEAYDDEILTPTPQAISRLYAEARYLQRLVEEMRLLSHSETGKLQLDRRPVAVEAILDYAQERLLHFGETDVPIVSSVADDLPPLSVDLPRIGHAIAILLFHALQNSPQDKPIMLSARQVDKRIAIDVSDFGEPIAASHRPTLFSTLHPRNNDVRPSGAGLGLMLVNMLTEHHDGAVSVTSDAPTTFTLFLPIA